jgi:hypothetical protein
MFFLQVGCSLTADNKQRIPSEDDEAAQHEMLFFCYLSFVNNLAKNPGELKKIDPNPVNILPKTRIDP